MRFLSFKSQSIEWSEVEMKIQNIAVNRKVIHKICILTL